MTLHSTPMHTFDWTSSEAVWRAVVDAVAEVTGTSPLDLSPFSGAVDAHALEALLQRRTADGRQVTVCFAFEGHRVLLSSAGRGYLYATA